MAEEKKSVFATLNSINCNDHTEQKNGLTYLSWAWAWQIVKSYYPDAQYTIYETPEGIPYWNDGRTAWVKTGVTINGLEHIEYLPVMDSRKNSIPLEKITSWDMNKTIQRSLTKAVARHGLGLYIYAGEDIPDEDASAQPEKTSGRQKKATTQPVAEAPAPAAPEKNSGVPDMRNLLPGGPDYKKVVTLYAKGKLSKSGEDYRTVWAKMVNAGEDLLEVFDHDVAEIRNQPIIYKK